MWDKAVDKEVGLNPLANGRCGTRFVSGVEVKLKDRGNARHNGYEFYFDGHRFFCESLEKYRSWKDYCLLGGALGSANETNKSKKVFCTIHFLIMWVMCFFIMFNNKLSHPHLYISVETM